MSVEGGKKEGEWVPIRLYFSNLKEVSRLTSFHTEAAEGKIGEGLKGLLWVLERER